MPEIKFVVESDPAVLKLLGDILAMQLVLEKTLQRIEEKEDRIMTQVAQEFESLRVAVADATTQVGLRIDQLSAGITNSMTDQEVATLKAGFAAEAARLKIMAEDPANPVP